jgi:D-alanine-D-alanine ligase
LRIGIAFDLAPSARPADGPDDLFEEFDKPTTIEAIARVLRSRGHEVVLLGDGRELAEKLLADPPDLVWNMAEGVGAGRSREARVPALCELLGIPCTGSDPLTLAASLDKPVAKRLVSEVVAVPRGCLIESDETVAAAEARIMALTDPAEWRTGPWILKPAYEGSSKGIRDASLVDSPSEAATLALNMARDYRQPILIEEFIDGDEVTVGLIGTGARAEVIGALRILPKVPNGRFVYSVEIKRDWDERIVYEIPARLPAATEARLFEGARRAYQTLGCRDVARIDFRVRDGVPYFLEANPLPGLAPDWSDLVFIAGGQGMNHDTLIGRILDAACARLGLDGSTSGSRPR